MKVGNKVLVVTGAGSGMGRELVLELLRRGARVAAVDMSRAGLDGTAELADAGERLSLHLADITDRRAVEALPEEVLERHRAIDGLINNAGIIQPFVKLADLELPAIEKVIAVNLMGTIRMVKGFLPHLLKRPEAHIANVSSMGAFLPVPGQSIYGASKAGVKLMTEGLYAELLDTRVGVSVIMPGAVSTNIVENSGVTMELGAAADQMKGYEQTAPDVAARTIVDGIERNRFHILVGKDAKAMFLACRLAPRWATHLIQKKMRALLGDAG